MDFMSFAYYENGVFLDFMITAVLNYLPDTGTNLNDGSFGNLGAVVSVNYKRSSSFFDSV